MSTVITPMTGEVLPRRIVRWLVVFVALASSALVVALVTGATTVFNVAVFVLFAGLWLVLGTTLVTHPDMAMAVWRQLRAKPMAVQLIVWVLLLPITAALWLWSLAWPTALRVTLIAAIAFVNLVMFVPRG